tara:strand:+ start:526 stop:1041 length:516 start_codon:yes stop_codon:yes gene_type:complete
MSGYVEFTFDQAQKVLVDEMGFKCINDVAPESEGFGINANEYVFERVIKHENPEDFMKALKGDDFRYSIRIFSSVDRRTKKTREIGSDAIRVTLYDLKKDRPVKAERRVNRTVNAFSNMKERARELWKYVADGEHICPKCESLLVKRTAKRSKKDFMGCSSYPACTHTQNI